jgi:hypothetical protein
MFKIIIILLMSAYMKKSFLILSVIFAVSLLPAAHAQGKIIRLPQLDGYVTLRCDFHMHTVFSDGNVWPLYRIEEALRDGLDAIAISDHIEYTPKKDYIPVNHNAAWDISVNAAREGNLLLVHAAEITRDMPPGHLNALFITDGAALAKDSVMDVIGEAVRQGAFIQWNHPGWKSQEPDGIPKIYDIHKNLIARGWLHGIEFYNEFEYYPLVLDMCKTYNLAVICNSDVHGIIREEYRQPYYRFRPMTLVFARERTVESLKEAMMNRRTIAFFRDTVAGMDDLVRPFFSNSITVGKTYYENKRSAFFEITNNSDITWHLVKGPQGAPSAITIPANSVTRVSVPRSFRGKLTYEVGNAITGPGKFLAVEIRQ